MEVYNSILKLKTNKEFEIINITKKVLYIFKKSDIKEGFINIYSLHTTLAVKVNEDEELLKKDIWGLMKRIAPDNLTYYHDDIKKRKNCPKNEPKNSKGHLRCIVLESFQTLPIVNKKIMLGKYQNIFAIETSGPRKREIAIQIIGIK